MIMFRAVFVLLAVAALTVIDASPAAAEIYRPWSCSTPAATATTARPAPSSRTSNAC